MTKLSKFAKQPLVQWLFWRLPKDAHRHRFAAFIFLMGIFGAGFFVPMLHQQPVINLTTANRAYAQVSFTAGKIQAMPKSDPVRLRIPTINAEAPFISLGL